MIKATNLASRIAVLLAGRGKTASFLDDVCVQDDGDGPRLVSWDKQKLGPEPTQSQIDAIDDLVVYRNEKWEEIKAARDAARNAGFLFNGKTVQSDAASSDNVAGAALAATIAKALGVPYSVEWTMADNSVMPLNGDQVIAMFMTGAEFVKTIYARGVTLREQLAQAETEEEIQAIAW